MSGIDAPTERKNAPLLRVEEHGEVLVVVLDRPDSKVNLIDEQWLAEMTDAVARAERDRPKGFVVRSAKPANFVAGADVDLIAFIREQGEAASRAAQGQELLNRIEDLPCFTLAAINGACLGGGLELALAFDTRIVADDESIQMGLPEVRLGILPGFAGTWRLPRRLGITTALPLILAGKSLRPKKALRAGLVDRIVAPEYLERVALEMAAAAKPPRRAKRKLGERITDFVLGRTAPGKSFLRKMTLNTVRKQTGGHYPAPFEIVDRVLDGYGAKRAKALPEEAQAFGRLAVTPVAKNLLFLFRGNEALGRHPWAGRPADVDRTSRRAAVIGAGTMGGGIAGALAQRGIDVRLKDVAIESLRLGMAGAAAPLNKRVKRRSLTPRERDAILARISPTLEDTGYGHVDFAIEAVPEILELKQKVFRMLEERMREEAYLATNTSSLPISTIAEGLRSPERLVGIHFFNPVDRMPLVEIIPGEKTRRAVVTAAVGLVRRLKKSPLVVADRPGFLVNRLLLPYLNEAALALEDGWPVEAVDGALLRFGMPMGPLTVLDEVGIDVASKVSGVMEAAFGERAKPAPVMKRLLDAEALGAKAGRGFWRGRGKERKPNHADLALHGAGPAPSDDVIVTRVLMGMVNEAARCLAEGVVSEPDHLDLGTVLGAGFPPFRGGVHRWALTLGEDRVRRDLESLATKHGERFRPADALGELFRTT